MSRQLAARTRDFHASETLDVIEKVNALKRRGVKITAFSNRPATPPEVIAAAQAALAESWSSAYTDTRGLAELRQATAEKSARLNGIAADPDTEVIVTIGAKGAIHLAMLSLVDPGDEVLLPDPEWVSYEPCVMLAGGRVVRFPLREENGFQPDVDDIARRITANTKLIVLNTPHNPTGAVFNASTLQGVAELAHKHDLRVLSDEVYEHYLYDGQRHMSIGALRGMKERTITVSGTSKIFNMFGWRVGWAIADRKLIDSMANIQQQTSACATSFAQAGTVAALKLGDEVIAKRVRQYGEARDALVAGLNSLPGISCHKPAGAYFAFPNIAKLGKPSAEIARLLLEQGGIQSVAGSAFGPHGEGYLRLVFACTPQDVVEGIERFRETLARI